MGCLLGEYSWWRLDTIMNWLKKIAQLSDPASIIMGVINNTADGSGPSVTQPAGGWAYQELKRLGPLPDICQMINAAAGINPAARPKMQILAEATGCQWTPENPPDTDQLQQPDMNVVPPMLGQQENPMDTPSVEIGE